jgi:two-component system nitrogen regulation sensor histidine kinase NtrY
MTSDLKASQEKLNEANLSLSQTNDLLEQRRQFIETVLENVNTGVITIDRAGKISTLNRAGERIMGIDKYEIMGKNYREVFESHQLDGIREQVRAMSESGEPSVERNVQMTVNRRTLTLRLFVSALHDTAGDYLGILVVFDDLTELIKAQRAAAWKEVARRIAHEVKNPLTPIQLSAQRLRKRFLEGTGDYGQIINECTETIITQVEGMKALVDEFSKFARMPEVAPQPNSLHTLIDEAAALYLGAHKDIEIMKDYDPGITVVNVDGEQMKRAFMNLFDNAVTAMDGKGIVYIKTAMEPGMIRVEVADEGPGIAPEDSERLFQPYFSKKKSGTGLGLAIVSRIISDHGGYIKVESNEPKGARFVIELPVKA